MRETYSAEERRAVAAAKARKVKANLRDKVFVQLGGMCASPTCQWRNPDGTQGCKDRRCLQIDHLNGNGAEERRVILKNGATVYLKRIIANPQDYQLLCANCNWIKRVEKGEHGGRNRQRE